MPAPADQPLKPGMLSGLRVVEIADELAEYCGLLLAGLGAEVIKIEPPEGSPTRRIGPFFGDDRGPGAVAVLLGLQPRQDSRSSSTSPSSGERFAAPARQRRHPARRTRRSLCTGDLGLDRAALNDAFPGAGHRAHDAVRRRRAVDGFQGLRPRPSGARRRDDELRLRSRPRDRIRPAADRAADLARLPHRRRAAGDRHHRRADRTASARARARTCPARCTRRCRRTPSSTS